MTLLAGGRAQEALDLHARHCLVRPLLEAVDACLFPRPPMPCSELAESVALHTAAAATKAHVALADLAARALHAALAKEAKRRRVESPEPPTTGTQWRAPSGGAALVDLFKSVEATDVEEWVQSSATWAAISDVYRAADSPVFAAALYHVAIRHAAQDDPETIQRLRVSRAEMLEEMGDFSEALAEVRLALRGRPADEAPGFITDAFARVAPRALGDVRHAECVGARARMHARADSARRIQRVLRGNTASRRLKSVLKIQQMFRHVQICAASAAWLQLALAKRDDFLNSRSADDDDAATKAKFDAARVLDGIEGLVGNQKERALAKRARNMPAAAQRPPRRTSAQRGDSRRGSAILRLQAKFRGDGCRARLRRVFGALPCGVRLGLGPGGIRAAPQHTISMVAAGRPTPRPTTGPVAATDDATLESLLRADHVVLRRFFLVSGDAVRILRLVGAGVRSLEVDCPRMGPKGLAAAAALVPQLEALNLRRCARALQGARGCAALGQALQRSTKLRRLDVAGAPKASRRPFMAPEPARLSRAACADFFDGCCASASLVLLRLTDIHLDDSAAKILAAALVHRGTQSPLRELLLERNAIGAAGARSLAVAAVRRQTTAPLWVLGLERQRPPLLRADVRDVARNLADHHVRARLRSTAGDWLVPADLAGFGFSAAAPGDDDDDAVLDAPHACDVGGTVRVRWLQQRNRTADAAWRAATVVAVLAGPPDRVAMRYEDGFEENVSPYAVRAQDEGAASPASPRRRSRPDAISYLSPVDGKVKLVSRDEVFGKLRDDHPESRLRPARAPPLARADAEALAASDVDLVCAFPPTDATLPRPADDDATFAENAHQRCRSKQLRIAF
ncbi:hypothetical protein M885DRAFT_530979 [Pelagophyceae sp. CCMP2097]|nr:hypothetical protein M885DRAFT_530979 [Pelagophyceae sp. CCMP2097]